MKLSRLYKSTCLSVYGLLLLPLQLQAKETETTVKQIADPVSAGNVVQVLFGMIAVLVLIVGLAWVFKRMGGLQTTMGKELRIVGGLSMGARERVVLVQVGEKQLLLGVAPGRIQTLYELEQPLISQQNDTGQSKLQGSFAEKLAATIRSSVKK
jgi:flagellar protein FliO/FliZ